MWVEVELPEGGFMECLLDIHRELLYSQIKQLLVNFNYSKMQEAINLVENKVAQLSTCCDPTARTSCDLCMTSEEIRVLFEGRNSISSPSSVEIDPIAFQSGTSRSSSLIGEDYWIVDLDGEGRLISEVVSDLVDLMAEIDLSFEAFVTSNSTTCDELTFQSIENDYSNSTADVRMRLHIDEVEGKYYEISDLMPIVYHYGEKILIDLAEISSGQENLEEEFWCKGKRIPDPLSPYIASKLIEDEPDGDFVTYAEGIAVHIIIQSFYIDMLNGVGEDNSKTGRVEVEFHVPKASKKNPGFFDGRADIVNLQNYSIYEIKTVGSFYKGSEEVDHYIHYANLHCSNLMMINAFKRGYLYPREISFYWVLSPFREKLKTYLDNRLDGTGVITYKFINKNEEDLKYEPSPSPNPGYYLAPRGQRVIKLIEDMLSSENPDQLARNHFEAHPADRYFIIATISLGGIGSLILAIKSGGTSLRLLSSTKLGNISTILLRAAMRP
ncbi:MAG: hypothetical protein EA362_11975 [Saprospirales bacterium]|nr:MAG: hypothetical protein EA362_11975 [Saprospirales bacterium]